MQRAASSRPLAAGARQSQPRPWDPWYARIGLLALGTLLLSLSYAPVEWYFCSWIGLAPWILAITTARSRKSAFGWGFAGAWAFFLVNMWWLWFVTPPGLFALTAYLSLFWGFAAIVIRGLLRDPRGTANPSGGRSILAVFLVAAVWVGIEWLRGNVSFLGRQGLPWLYLGQAQSPVLVMCQIADVASVLGVSFWVALVNATVAVLVMRPAPLRRVIRLIAVVSATILVIGGYGAFRLAQKTTYPGPTVLVVQSNYRQSNTGEKGAPMPEIVEFHVTQTRAALEQCAARGQRADLVVWSETMMPPLNRSAREFARDTIDGALWQRTFEAISEIAVDFNTSLLVGAVFHDDWAERDGYLLAADRRNSAFLFGPAGQVSDLRYDKIHLVPFGEYIPFKESIPLLYRLFIRLGPNYYEEYVLSRGSEFTVFPLETQSAAEQVRFVVPICFEDIVPSLVARMVSADGSKRAEFLVNITNDGWFRANQMPQHLQAAIFRSIENRMATARSVNTGISALIDPLGRVQRTVAAGTEGWAFGQLVLDRRVAPYTRIGDAFPIACAAVTGAVIVSSVVRRGRGKVNGESP